MKQFVYLMFVYLLSLSCSDNDHEDVMRDLDVYDGIKVSCADVEMSDMNDTVDVRVEGKDWVLADVMVDGEKYAVTARASEVVNQILPVCYEFDWLSVLCTSDTLRLIAESNKAFSTRDFRIVLQDVVGHTLLVNGVQGGCADLFGLSVKEVSFPWRGGTIAVDVHQSGWNMSRIEYGDKIRILSQEEKDMQQSGMWSPVACGILTVQPSDNKLELRMERNEDICPQTKFKIIIEKNGCEDSIKGTVDGMPDGDWGDVVGLSATQVDFRAFGGCFTVGTTGIGWALCEVVIDGEIIPIPQNSVASHHTTGKAEYTYRWLNVKCDKQSVMIKVDGNNSGAERQYKLRIVAGDYYCWIQGVQKSD